MQAFDPNAVAVRTAHFIEGGCVNDGSERLVVRRPSDGQPHGELPLAGPAMVDRAVRGARKAFETSGWATCAPRSRAKVLRRWATLVEEDTGLPALEAVCSTRPIADATDWDIPTTAECIRFFAEWADKAGGEVTATREDALGLVISEPFGVIAAIAPWNFPLVIAIWKLAPALAAGNAVVLKPSEMTPFSVIRLAELAVQAGVPPGIFNIVQGTGQITGDALCRHPDIAKITFTGSTRTGLAIMAASASVAIRPVTLELGGKSPQLLFADAPDLGRVSDMVSRAITGNAGQVCVAGSRLIVQEGVADQVVDGIARHMASLRPGPTWSVETTLPPIISEAQAERIDGIIRRSVAEGATVATGGVRAVAPQGGAYYMPTILTNVTSQNEAVREEVFGPVLTVQTFHDEEEGFALAAHPTYGLAAGVHTGALRRAMRAVRRIEAGTVWINRYGRSDDFIIPTGGFKGSGIGKDLGRAAFEANQRHKSVLLDFA